jgi:hypothetical protein
VSTRKLIVAALVCGLLILVAGVIQLFRITDTKGRDVQILHEGQPATVGGVALNVTSSALTDQALAVTVRFSPATPATTVPVTSFTLLAGGKLEPPSNTARTAAPGCPASIPIDGEGLTCVLTFPPRGGTATLSFSRADQQQLWQLDPAGA